MRKSLFIAAALWALPVATSSASRSVYVAPEVRDDADLYELLVFNTVVDHASGSTLDWRSTTVVRDGSPIRLYFQSRHSAPRYGFCYKFSYYDSDYDVRTRHGCLRWRDAEQHSTEILSSTEAKRLTTLRVHTYDARGVPSDWDGSGDPPGMLAHDVEDFTFKDASIASQTIELFKSAITTSAKGVLLCAHPTATYKGVSIDDVSIGSKVGVDFTIDYQCNGLLERPCAMSLRATFSERRFEGLKVTADTALTDATIGLDVCGGLIRDVLNAVSGR